MYPGIQPILNTVLETLPGVENLDKLMKFVWIYLSLYWDIYGSYKRRIPWRLPVSSFQFNNTKSG